MNRPYVVQSPEGKFTIGFLVTENGRVLISSAFCGPKDAYTRRKGYDIVTGRLRYDTSCDILKVKLKNPQSVNSYRKLLLPLIDLVKNMKFERGHRSAKAVRAEVIRMMEQVVKIENSIDSLLEARSN